MGSSKINDYSDQQKLIAKFSKALAHPARVAILNLLLKKKSCICGDIVLEIPLSQSTVSQHLKELKKAGLIRGKIEGSKICYCIDELGWNKAKLHLNKLFKITVLNHNCC